ncbi:MAG: hypothetical protein OCD02_07150 [Spirochaetaceae bacterium]
MFKIILMLFIPYFIFSQDKVLKLVYKETGKVPYMQKAPDNSGLYLDLMSRAAEKIGFEIDVIRLPKQRTYKMLELGDADLYASGEFRDYRSNFLFYFSNGLYREEIFYGLTTSDIPELLSISDINRYNLTWEFELGNSWPILAKRYNVKYHQIKDGNVIDKAILLLKAGRPLFFRFTIEEIEEYLKSNNLDSLGSLGIKIHQNLGDKHQAPLYASFSRFSKYYKEQKNIKFNSDKRLGVDNFPVELVPGSIPYKLQSSLLEMIESGEVELLIKKYGFKK